MLRRSLIITAASVATPLAAPPAFAQRGQESFEITASETATIDGRQWDTPMPGGTTMDAVHRSVLLRFPGAADQIADLLRAGRVLLKAELALRFAGTEIVPEGLSLPRRAGPQGVDREPAELARAGLGAAPSLEGRQGARADLQRFGQRQALLGALRRQRSRATGSATGPSRRSCRPTTRRRASTSPGCWRRRCWRARPASGCAGSRSRASCCTRSRPTIRATATPGRRLRMGDADRRPRPALRRAAPGRHACGAPGHRSPITLPLDLKEEWELSQPDGSRPTAVLPSPAEVAARARKAMQVRGPRPPWEAARLAELLAVAGDRVSAWGRIKSEADYQAYRNQLKQMLPVPPRYWEGWDIQEDLLLWYVFRDLLPAPAQDHLRNYWTRLAAARPADRRLRPSAEPRRDRLLEAQQGLARPRLVLPRRLLLRGQHAELQSHRGDGRAAGRRR